MSRLTDILETVIPAERITEDADMSREVSFRAGGKADALAVPENKEELKALLKLLSRENIPHTVMGNGSNLLIKDGGFRGVVVKMTGDGFSEMEILDDGVSVKAGCAVMMSTFARFLAENSLTGFEFASGIPGCLGGAVFMNAGAYGGEIKDVIVEAEAVSADGEREFTLTGEQLELGYRHSILKETGDIVTGITFRFEKGDREEIEDRMKELNRQRNAKQPVNYPSAGSTFKRPEGYFAGKLVQDAGLKGYTCGGAQVSELHSGFVINIGGATATDILNVMKHCREEVERQFGVTLEPEVRILGEDPDSGER